MTLEFLLALTCLAVVCVVSGFVHSAIGFGYAIVALSALAAMPFVMDARTAHVMLPIASLPMLGSAAWAYRKGTHWPSLRPALIGAAIMMPVGLYLFNNMSLDLLVRGTGLVIFVMVLFNLRNRQIKVTEPTSGGSSLVTGIVCGFLAGAVNIAGPPAAAYGLKQGWSPDRFKAFVSQLLLVVSIYKVIGLGIGDNITREAALFAVWTTPFSIAGIQLGVWVSKYIAPQRFQRIVAIVLIGVACMLMLRGSPPKTEPTDKPEATVVTTSCRGNLPSPRL